MNLEEKLKKFKLIHCGGCKEDCEGITIQIDGRLICKKNTIENK